MDAQCYFAIYVLESCGEDDSGILWAESVEHALLEIYSDLEVQSTQISHITEKLLGQRWRRLQCLQAQDN